MPIVADKSGNNPGNPATNGWTGVDPHDATTKELQQEYYASGGASTFSQTLFLLATAAAWRTGIGADNAANITSGVFDPARIPVINSAIQIISSGDLTALTAPQQALIIGGAVVTTTDGFRWLYSGTGSKTLSASYIQLSDISPDWSTIANRPITGAATTVTQLSNTTAGVAGASTNAALEDHAHPYPLGTVNVQTGTTYTIAASDHGKVVKFGNASAVAVILPNNLPAGFNCGIASNGAGKVTFTPQAGATLVNRQTFFSLAGNKAEGGLRIDNNGGATAEWWISGDLQA